MISARIQEHEKRFPVSSRFDRVMWKATTEAPYWRCEKIELVGTEAIGNEPDGKYMLFTSDHFGILTTFVPIA